MKRLLLATVLWIASTCSAALADVSAVWQDTTESLARQVIERSNIVSDFVELIDQHFITDKGDLKNLRVTVTNAPSPMIEYRTENAEIILPYNYLIDAITAHAELEETHETALDRALNTVEYTLYHLFGHTIANDNSPDADDTAESLSSWLMIRGFRNGGEQWFANTEAFARASQLIDGPLSDYWHSHALYKSRQRTINCWILGSNPEEYERLFKQVLEPDKRKADCVSSWQTLESESLTLLEAYLKQDSTLRGQ